MPEDIATIYLKIPVNQIVLLKFLLESYEGIAELRTLKITGGKAQPFPAENSPTGEAVVVILATTDTLDTVQKMLDGEKKSLAWQVIPRPAELKGDWLLENSDL